jgi:hypothetical protein
MKNKKCALGCIALAASVAALTGCDRSTPVSNGVIFSYTDANGLRTTYTTEDLLGSYRESGATLGTEFDKIYEVLIRNYYQTTGKSQLSSLEAEATQAVLTDKRTAQTNAANNNTSYEQEFETILSSNNVDNVHELWSKHLYDSEKAKFEKDLYENFYLSDAGVNGTEALRDGYYYAADGQKHQIFDFKDSDYGKVQEGWIKDQMPYEIRHILVKLSSGADKSYTQDKITESTAVGEGGECTTISTVLEGFAGAAIGTDGKLGSIDSDMRQSFDYLSQYSDDDGSKSSFGEYASNGPMTKSQNSSLVHEFIYGVYAYESLYNQVNKDSSKNAYGAENAYRIAPGLVEDANSLPDSTDSTKQINNTLRVRNENGESVTVYDYFKDEGIGSIPFGAVMALADAGKVTTDDNGGKVNDGNEKFYPRNIIYNKYFNKHNVCVITPNAVAYNATPKYTTSGVADGYRATWANEDTINAATAELNKFYNPIAHSITDYESTDGAYSKQFGDLPGFQVNTTDVLPQYTHNVLTDSDGEIILAVRAGATSYQGIHFITIKRSALDEYGKSYDASTKSMKINTLNDVGTESNGKISYTKDSPSLSDYYTIYSPDTSYYPTYTADGKSSPLSTYVNFNVHDKGEYSKRAGWISESVKNSFSSNQSTYLFQYLVENGKIQFNDASLESAIKNYVKIKRQSTYDSAYKTWSDNWREYAEALVAQNEARSVGYTAEDKANGTLGVSSTLITEAGAIEYGLPSKAGNKLWSKGGACYYPSNTND